MYLKFRNYKYILELQLYVTKIQALRILFGYIFYSFS